MREILFRGKVPEDFRYKDLIGSWVEGNLVHQTEHYGDPIDRYHILYTGEFDCDFYDNVIVIPETVGQWTGLTDKNGKKIFEGDIVKDEYSNAVVKFGRHSIPCCGCCYTWHDSVGFYLDFGEYIGSDEHSFDDLEVIGNIHDNPELLEVK